MVPYGSALPVGEQVSHFMRDHCWNMTSKIVKKSRNICLHREVFKANLSSLFFYVLTVFLSLQRWNTTWGHTVRGSERDSGSMKHAKSTLVGGFLDNVLERTQWHFNSIHLTFTCLFQINTTHLACKTEWHSEGVNSFVCYSSAMQCCVLLKTYIYWFFNDFQGQLSSN